MKKKTLNFFPVIKILQLILGDLNCIFWTSSPSNLTWVFLKLVDSKMADCELSFQKKKKRRKLQKSNNIEITAQVLYIF